MASRSVEQAASTRIPKIKEEQRVLPTYDQTAIKKLMDWKPKGQAQTRLQTLVMTLADIGAED